MLNLVIKVNKQNHRILPFLFLLNMFSHSNWEDSKIHVSLFFSVQCFV